MANIEAIIFDAEGVVINTEHLWDEAQRDFLEAFDRTYERDAIKPLLAGRNSTEGIRILRDRLGLPGSLAELESNRLGHMLRHLDDVTFIDGFVEFFAKVTPHFKTVLATSMNLELFHAVDARLGLSDLFANRVVTNTDVAGRGKPQPDIFLRAASMVATDARDCLVIEDSPIGIRAAANAGMVCVALTTTFPSSQLVQAQRVFQSFHEIDVDELDALTRLVHPPQ